jgi:hypothetical protein
MTAFSALDFADGDDVRVSQDEPRHWNLFKFDSYGKCEILRAQVGPRRRDARFHKGGMVH